MVHVDDVMFCGDGAYLDVFLKGLKQRYSISHSQLEGVDSESQFLKRTLRRVPHGFAVLPGTSIAKVIRFRVPVPPQVDLSAQREQYSTFNCTEPCFVVEQSVTKIHRDIVATPVIGTASAVRVAWSAWGNWNDLRGVRYISRHRT